MYGTNLVSGGLTLGKVLTTISRGLSIANQIIPIYQQAKPMITNARKIISVMKEMSNTTANNLKTIDASSKEKNPLQNKNTTKKESTPIKTSSISMPVFFQ